MTVRLHALDRAPHLEPHSREEWRRWLSHHHSTATGVWLVSRRRASERDFSYDAAVEEALCAAAVDSDPSVRRSWDTLPRSLRRQFLTSIITARRAETRARRIVETLARLPK